MVQPLSPFPTYWTEPDLELLPDDGHRYEIVDGSLLVTPPPKETHQGIGVELLVRLKRAAPDGWRVRYEIGVRVPGGNFVPDVVVLKPGSGRGLVWHEPDDIALVVEIGSPATKLVDRAVKSVKYAEAGIPNYWQIDLDGTLTVHTDPGVDGYCSTQVVAVDERAHIDSPFSIDFAPADLLD